MSRLVFVDESGVELGAPPRMARSQSGTRAWIQAPARGKRLSMVGAIRLGELVDLQVYEGTTDGVVFLHWVQHHLAPRLHPGDIVLLDNLSIHHRDGVDAAIRAAGAELLFLPAYSPDFSPIEPFWGKLKALARRVGARTRDAMEDALAEALDRITPADFSAWFGHCGWVQPA